LAKAAWGLFLLILVERENLAAQLSGGEAGYDVDGVAGGWDGP